MLRRIKSQNKYISEALCVAENIGININFGI